MGRKRLKIKRIPSDLRLRSLQGTDERTAFLPEKCRRSDTPCEAFMASNRHANTEKDGKSLVFNLICGATSVSKNLGGPASLPRGIAPCGPPELVRTDQGGRC